MQWNWQQPDWPNFRYDSSQLKDFEAATRDLHELVEMGALSRTGERKHTRYYLNVNI